MGTCVRSVAHPAYIRDKARQMRAEKDLTIDEIAERLGISRQTIFYWVRDVPLKKPRRRPEYVARRTRTNSLRYKALRDAAYEAGWREYDALIREPGFRDFVCMYIGEGYKRSRNTVSLCNSDADVIVLADRWIRRFARNRVVYEVQHHADQLPEDLREFWSQRLRIPTGEIRLFKKSNSGQLRSRTWRCLHGVMSVKTYDTLLRARLQAWMDRVREDWVDSVLIGA